MTTRTDAGLAAGTRLRLIQAEELASILARDREATRRWEPARTTRYYTPDGQTERIAGLLVAHDQGRSWPGVIEVGGELIGQVTVSGILRFPFERGFIGYWVGTAHQRRGYATAAVNLVLQVMRDELQLHHAEAHTQLDNLASQAVLRRNGFSAFGVAPAHIYIDGAWRDDLLWQRALREGPPQQCPS